MTICFQGQHHLRINSSEKHWVSLANQQPISDSISVITSFDDTDQNRTQLMGKMAAQFDMHISRRIWEVGGVSRSPAESGRRGQIKANSKVHRIQKGYGFIPSRPD